jgi:hypothetical protein
VHGSVFGTVTSSALAIDRRAIGNEESALTYQRDLGYQSDVGAEVGGPIHALSIKTSIPEGAR